MRDKKMNFITMNEKLGESSDEEDQKDRHIPPRFGWQVKLNHVFKEKPKVFVFPRLSQASKLAGFAYRYIKYCQKQRKNGKTPFIDPYAVESCKQIYGVPLGGLGTGTIGRGWQGDFNRWQLSPGMYSYDIVEVNQFTVCVRRRGKTIYQKVLSPIYSNGRVNIDKNLRRWRWDFDGGRGFYHALYPRAWTVYELPELSLRLTCRQVSPIFPNNYKDTSLPVGVFVWTVENLGFEDVEVTIMLTFQNGCGTSEDSAGGHYNEEFFCKGVYSKIKLEKKGKNTVDINNNSNNNRDCCKTEHKKDDHIKANGNISHTYHNGDVRKYCDAGVSKKYQYQNGGIHRKYQNGDTIKKEEYNYNGSISQKLVENMNSTEETCLTHDVQGVLLHHNSLNRSFTLAISALQVRQDHTQKVSVSTKVNFDPKSTCCQHVWDDLFANGQVTNKIGDSVNKKTFPGQTLAAAVSAKVHVKPDGKEEMKFVLAWDQPVVEFGSKKGIGYHRRYTRFFGSKGNACPALCCYAFQNLSFWETQISEWQDPILSDSTLPAWFKSALFNELYFISDGGTVWLDIKRKKDVHGQLIPECVKEYGRFAYLEGHEYRMYNTYDVHFYASWALAMLWPKLQLSLQYDIASSVFVADNETRTMMMQGGHAKRKVPNCVPHDLGDPDDEPFVRLNAYCIHDTSCWKDLNLHFVLQVYRDYCLTNDQQFLMDMWPAMKAAMTHSLTHDSDGDGLIDNSGFADNTFDCWIVSGPSAYTGGLWLAALKCIIKVAHILELSDSMQKFRNVLDRGKRSFERKLWNGMYFNYDGSESELHNRIMAGQLAGQWYLHACDLAQNEDESVFKKEQIRSTLKVIFQNNVMRFEGGFMGAVNGMRAGGTADTESLQAEEVWVGVTYALAATMIQQGMIKEGFRTAEGVYRTVYDKWGLGFQTPEAITARKTFRSRGYMRPLSIWGMYHAHLRRKGVHSRSYASDCSPLHESVC